MPDEREVRMKEKLTLAEIAKIYKCSERTFNKWVALYSIPFESLGKSKRFDLAKVERCLEAKQSPRVEFSAPVKSKLKLDKGTAQEEYFMRELGLV